MALSKCKECGNEVSDSAATCPKCGARLPNIPGVIMSIRAVLITGLVLYAFSVFSEDGIGGIFSSIFGSSAHSVTYYVEGSARSASLTYTNEKKKIEQEDVTVPWQKTFRMQPDNPVSISAWNLDGSEISVRIAIDGNEFKRDGPADDVSARGICCK